MTDTRALVILQARMGSTRLPGKVLASVSGTTVLECCVRRLVAAGAGPVVVATTVLRQDDAIAAAVSKLDATVVRGPVEDVLGRFLLAARDWRGRFVIRATADNPLVDIDACQRVLNHLISGADYVVEPGLPAGAAVEGMTTSALRTAGSVAVSPYDRKHVTPWLRRGCGGIRMLEPIAPAHLGRPDLRFTVDSGEDLAFVRRVSIRTGGAPLAPLADLITAADLELASCPQRASGAAAPAGEVA